MVGPNLIDARPFYFILTDINRPLYPADPNQRNPVPLKMISPGSEEKSTKKIRKSWSPVFPPAGLGHGAPGPHGY